MRKHTVRNAVVTVVVVAVALLVVGRVGYWQTHYDRNGVVTEVESGNVAVVTNTTGNEWAVVGEPLSVGDKVTLHMHTQGTDNTINDDTVLSVSIH